MGMTGGPGAQCRGWGELQREPWGGPLLRPPGVPASSVTGDRESRAQAQQGERLRGWTPAAACRLVGALDIIIFQGSKDMLFLLRRSFPLFSLFGLVSTV